MAGSIRGDRRGFCSHSYHRNRKLIGGRRSRNKEFDILFGLLAFAALASVWVVAVFVRDLTKVQTRQVVTTPTPVEKPLSRKGQVWVVNGNRAGWVVKK